ncbi:type II and III secretion system protein family protein [Dyella agri]|uniref:Type II and III secretion system protein family protein n=1 Tax=Dyella agri TaxID=1926869 RepID=A0ABW8KK54_9GAMM
MSRTHSLAATGLVAAIAVLSLAPAVMAAAPEASVVLQVHEQRPWTLPRSLERVAIADPAVADLVMLKGRREALLVGKQAGQTTLLIWQRGEAAPQRLAVQVRGAVQEQLQDGSGTGLTVQDGTALLRGSVPSLLDHERSREAAAAAVGDKGRVADTSTVDSGGVVQVDVKVVEFDKTAMSQIGLNFQAGNNGFSYGFGKTAAASGNGSGSGGALSSAFSLVAGHKSADGHHFWNADIDLLQSDGMARVLAEPSLVALSGQSASFLAGGELPIPEPQGLGTTTIIYKQFGIGLTVTPTVLSADRIALKVAPEASDLDYTNAVTLDGISVPAITTRRADTTVELGDGETFVIGGLVSQSISSQVDKIPLLGDIPVIGVFFRDLSYSRQDKELVIAVTPHLIKPFARGSKLPMPGQREAQPNQPVWGSFLLNPAGSDQLPGFSR